jgi:hypothetical protein
MARKKKVSPLAEALLETADDMRKAGLMDKAAADGDGILCPRQKKT